MEIFISIITIIFIVYIATFILSLYLKDNSIADVLWWLAFGLVAIMLFLYCENKNIAHFITFALIILWSLRISSHIAYKKFKKAGEDKRYAKWRTQWKYFYTRSFFQVYMLQMVLVLLVSTPIFIIFYNTNWYILELSIIWAIISAIWLWYEIVADKQLNKFIKENKKINMICTKWLWYYSRHPNYLWEIVFWLGISVISIQYSIFWILWFVVISLLIGFVSWVPMKEKIYKSKNNYKDYKEKTPLFIPNFFKK